jgi:L-iditol 2-dehydrogenase
MSEKTMRAMIYHGPGDLRLEEVPVPEPADDELLVRVRATTTCGTDLKAYKRPYRLLDPPCGFGHEFSGDVAKAGKKVKGFEPGMRVTAHNSAPCNRCFYCKHGQHNLCDNMIFNYGTYREYHIVPGPIVALNTFPIPDHVPYAQAPLIEPLMCVVHGQRVLQVQHGERVAVFGAGPIGLMHIQLSRLAGAVQVIAADMSDNRLRIAEKLGATHTVNASRGDTARAVRELTGGRGVDVAIEAAGAVEAWHTAINAVRKGGRVEFFGGLKEKTPVELDTSWIHYGELTLHGTFHGTPMDVHRAYELIVSGTVDTASLISDEMPLEKAVEALERMDRGEVIKVALRPDLPAG